MRITTDFILQASFVASIVCAAAIPLPMGSRVMCSIALSAGLVAAVWIRRFMQLASKNSSQNGTQIVLESIRASHFAEKVRWCLDRAGVDYREEASVAVLGVFLLARSVPRLRLTAPDSSRYTVTGSGECMKVLYAQQCARAQDGSSLDWLRPTAEREALSSELDRYGRQMQVMLYSILLKPENRALLKHCWGLNDLSLPFWQRALCVPLLPVLVGFIKMAFPARTEPKARENAAKLLKRLDDILGSGQPYVMGDKLTYCDISLASLSYLWALDSPAATARFSNGGDRGTVSKANLQSCTEWQAWQNDFRMQFPRVHAHINRLYQQERGRVTAL